MSAQDHFRRQVHGWNLWDFCTEWIHLAQNALASRLAIAGSVIELALDFYYKYLFHHGVVLYALLCFLWVVCLPNRPFPRVRGVCLFSRRLYAWATFSSVYFYREALWALFGPPVLRLPPVAAIIVFVYLVLNRVVVSPTRTKPHQV